MRGLCPAKPVCSDLAQRTRRIRGPPVVRQVRDGDEFHAHVVGNSCSCEDRGREPAVPLVVERVFQDGKRYALGRVHDRATAWRPAAISIKPAETGKDLVSIPLLGDPINGDRHE
jgi:hypothetical protein